MIYIPILLILIPAIREKLNYVFGLCLGVFVVFPLANNFRYWKEGEFSFNYELFNTAHFDAFQNFILLLNEKIITNGEQLLGSILFFVQENTWPNRPVGTGQMLAETLGFNYTNVTMPFLGEGYANWGLLGVFLFLLFIAILNAFFDSFSFLTFRRKTINFFYLVFLGFEFYLLRGDLMSSIKIFTSFLIAVMFVEICVFFQVDNKNYIEKT
ncbi:hypothetical protein ACFLRU_06390 [Bacteroidota bacterium]